MANPKFKELSPDQQKFIEELKIEGTKTIDVWHSFFLGLAHFDKRGDLLRSSGCFFNTFFSTIILFGAGYALFFLIQGEGVTSVIIPVVAIVVSILLLVASKRYYKEFEDRDIPNPLRSFLAPFLELLKQDAVGHSMMELALDLKPMDDLMGVKSTDKTTDPFEYLSLSSDLPDSCVLALKITAHGVKYQDNYRLTHDVVLGITYDDGVYDLSKTDGPFNVSVEENRIIIKTKYKEHSNAKIEHDPGPNYRRFVEAFRAMQDAVEKKSN